MTDRPLTQNIRPDGSPTFLADYEANGGYAGLRKALSGMTPEACLEEVKGSRLRGRGGAGFPTGMKWSFVPMGEKAGAGHKYLIANADEMEPGTFKDRLILEQDPHQLLEGMMLAAYTIQADIAYVFLRGEYVLAAERLTRAISECYEAGYLGNNILNSGYSLELRLHRSAGRYICGEETALINALEGKRANPRPKPPFPQVSGLWGRPSIVNNVETLCNITHIITRGADWYQTLGRGEDSGTKLFGASGNVRKPGVWELPMGTPVREILEDHAGGMRDGYQLRGFLPGGGSTDFLTTEHLDLAMDYDVIGKAGSRMGTGTMIVLDDRHCPIGMVRNLSRFFAHESCGFCTPCRDGIPWIVQLLDRFEDGQATQADIELLREKAAFIGGIGNTHCALAPGAMEPVNSALKYFYEDFERHVTEGGCTYHGRTGGG